MVARDRNRGNADIGSRRMDDRNGVDSRQSLNAGRTTAPSLTVSYGALCLRLLRVIHVRWPGRPVRLRPVNGRSAIEADVFSSTTKVCSELKCGRSCHANYVGLNDCRLAQTTRSLCGRQPLHCCRTSSQGDRQQWAADSTGERNTLGAVQAKGAFDMKQRPRIYYSDTQKASHKPRRIPWPHPLPSRTREHPEIVPR